MSRDRAIAHAERYFDEGGFFADLARRVAIPTERQNPERKGELECCLAAEGGPRCERDASPAARIARSFARLGFTWRIFPNSKPAYGPFLVAERIEDPSLVTVFTY